MEFFQSVDLDGKAAEAIARGLYAIARVDGLHEREAGLIAAFWIESGAGTGRLSDLEREKTPITAEELKAALSTPQLRLLFMKTAILLTYADGVVTPEERQILGEYSAALGVDAATVATLENNVKEYLLEQLAHLNNTDATVEVAKKLGV
jgi:tellurite resistance protein